MKKRFVIPAALVGGVVLSATSQPAFAATGQDIVNQAMKYQGVPYEDGAPAFQTAGFDCSSFVQYIFREVYGVTLPRTSASQANQGVSVSRQNLQPGDLLFFATDGPGKGIHHVGIYVGNGKMISAELTVGVHVTNVFSGGGAQNYWEPLFVKAQRIALPSSSSVHNQAQSSALQASAVSHTAVSKAAASSGSTYTVQGGDSLWGIAQAHGTTVSALKAANHLSSNTIYPGQKLSLGTTSISASVMKTTSSTVQKSTSAAAKSSSYTVKTGDSLWKIAHTYGTSVSAIKAQNHLSSDMIYIGQTLSLDGSASSTGTVATASSGSSGGYVVKSGDNLWEISLMHQTSVNKLMKANNLSSTLIYPGMNLVIPN